MIGRVVSAAAIVGALMSGGCAIAHADTYACSDGNLYLSSEDCPGKAIPTVNLSDVPFIDQLPICNEEDCSDQNGQIGVWTSHVGNSYIELGEGVTVMVIDNTVAR